MRQDFGQKNTYSHFGRRFLSSPMHLLTYLLVASALNIHCVKAQLGSLPAASTPFIASGSTSPRTPAVRAADRLNLLDYAPPGAQVDQTGTDDASAALGNAIQAANAAMTAGHLVCIYLPAGTYEVNTPLPPFTQGNPGCIIGEGPQKSIINLGASFTGDLFAWSDAWPVGGHSPGAHVANLRINGSQSHTGQQNALVFYDRNDNVSLENVDIWNLAGRALYAGATKNTPAAYIRESHFRSLRFFSDGAPGIPVVEFNADDHNHTEDASNEIDVDQMDIFGPNGPGLVIRSRSGTVRDFKFNELRVDGTYNGTTAADLVTIGDASFQGSVIDISFTNAELLLGYRNYAAIRTTAANPTAMPYGIYFQGEITGNSQGEGIRIDAGRSMKFELSGLVSAGPNVVVGMAPGSDTVPQATSMVGGNIILDGFGVEPLWTYAISPANANSLMTPLSRVGVPGSTGASSGTSFMPGTFKSNALTTTTDAVTSGQALSNQLSLAGSSSGKPVTITAAGQDGNIALSITGKGGSGVATSAFVADQAPGSGDIPPDACADWNNLVDGSTRRYCNTGGSIRRTQQGRLILTYSTAGSYTATVPSWATPVDIEAVGGGSSGANGTSAPLGVSTSGGAGGSGGGRVRRSNIPTTILAPTVDIVVAAGGAVSTGPGAPGLAGGTTTVSSGAFGVVPAYGGGAPSGGSATPSASGGAAGPYTPGGNATNAIPGSTPYGGTGVTGVAGTFLSTAGSSSVGGGGAVGGPGGGGGNTPDGVTGAGAGGGVDATGAGYAGGGQPAQGGFGFYHAGVPPGGAGSTSYNAFSPGMNPVGGAGGAGGDGTHAAGNGAAGSGPGAPGGGGGSSISGQPFGSGAAGQDGQVILVFSP